MQMSVFFILVLLSGLVGCGGSSERPSDEVQSTTYPLHSEISTTVFWVGEVGSTENGQIPNIASAWDDQWVEHFGGVDAPDLREGYRPAGFEPLENPFYAALPFNDIDGTGKPRGDLARFVPWALDAEDEAGALNTGSILKNRWLRIVKGGKEAYAQWEDVGPFGEDDWPYVFGGDAPLNTINNHAGLDVSPAVRDYLGLDDIDRVDWQFVEASAVPAGPWEDVVTESPVNGRAWFQPGVDTTWQWQLSGTVNTGYAVDVYDIDLFDSSPELIQQLHSQGRKVVCYFSAGSFENWRSDQAAFPEAVLGQPLDGWAGERWLDIRAAVVQNIMRARLDLAAEKGCDAVEPDNVDGYTNNTGFALNEEDQFVFNRFLATEAHQRELGIGLKNDLNQIPLLEPFFDFSVNEQCHEYAECGSMTPFIVAGKPVFNAEYQSRFVNNINGARDALCAQATVEKLQTLVLPLLLDDSFRHGCTQ